MPKIPVELRYSNKFIEMVHRLMSEQPEAIGSLGVAVSKLGGYPDTGLELEPYRNTGRHFKLMFHPGLVITLSRESVREAGGSKKLTTVVFNLLTIQRL